MPDVSIAHIPIKKVEQQRSVDADDILAIEEPLEIRLIFHASGAVVQKSISVTMRTPGNDLELAVGFLYTEGIILAATDVVSVEHNYGFEDNVVNVTLSDNVQPDMERLERNFYTTSSCGVCGKSSIKAVKTICSIPVTDDYLQFNSEMIYGFPAKLRRHQEVFEQTGGLHACALFDSVGNLSLMREDVGRHNALDKLIGTALNANMLPLDKYVLLLSGRASFELVQKATMAGIKIIAAVGAPSNLAVSMAAQREMTLIGFLRNERFNIYTGAQRVVV